MSKKLPPERREALKEKLLKELEAEVESYLDWYDGMEDIKFRDIEQKVLGMRKRMSARLAQSLVEEESAATATMRHCPVCGTKLQKKGEKDKVVVSLTGEVEVKRDYYYCPQCRRGFFPSG